METQRFTYEASVFNGEDPVALQVKSFTWSMDMDRVPFMQGSMVVVDPGNAVWNQMDPRPRDPGSVILYKVHMYTTFYDSLELHQTFPPGPTAGKMWIQSATRNIIDGTVTLELASGEAKTEEKRQSTTAAVATGATTVRALVDYLLNKVGESPLASYDSIVNTTALPSGERRDWQPGDTANDMLEPELDAINCRLWCTPTGTWTAGNRDTPPASPTSPVTLYGGRDGEVIDAQHARTREGEYYDSALIKYEYTPAGTTTPVINYYASSTSAAPIAKTRYITRDRPRPSNDPTDAMAARDRKRGDSLIIQSFCRVDIWPGATLTLADLGNGVTYPPMSVRAVTFNPAEGTIELGAQT